MLQLAEALLNGGHNVSVTQTDRAAGRPSDALMPAPDAPPVPRRGRPKRGNGASAADVAPVSAPPSIVDDDDQDDTPAVDLAGDDEPQDEGGDFGLSDPGLTGQEAKELALGGIRRAYNAGAKDQVRALHGSYKTKFNITKFDELPPVEGHTLYKDVARLLEKLGMHI
jgi:hypothetical protein